MGKHCLALLAGSALLVLASGVVFFIIYTAGDDICTTKKCVQTANELMTSLDQSVAACDDFFDFACGNVPRLFARQHPHGFRGGFELAEGGDEDEGDYVRQAKRSSIERMMEEPVDPGVDTKTLAKIKTFYRSCTRLPDANGTFGGITVSRLRAVFADFGGWPMLERGNWRETRFDWITAVHYLRKIGIDHSIFIATDIEVNQFDITRYILTIHMADDFLGGAKINTKPDKKLFLEYMIEVAAYFGVDRVRGERDFTEIMEFYEQSRKITDEAAKNVTRRSRTRMVDHEDVEEFNPRSITQLQHDVPGIRWKAYLNGIVGLQNVQLSDDEFVNTPNLNQLRRVIELLHKTPKKILANYLCWRVIQAHVEHLPDPMLHEKLAGKFAKFHRRRNRREICARLIRSKLPEMVEASYVRRYVTDDVKRVTKDIIEAIKRQLVRIADALDWLDADIKQVSKEKLASVHDYVAHTPEMPSATTAAPDVYERIDFAADRFMANLMMVRAANADRKFAQLRTPVVHGSYDRIEYSVIKNSLVLPSDYLLGFYVDETRPMYMNFGTLGTLIAYQLANVFLDGKRYDVHGALREWSTSQSLFNYDNKTRCLTKQYEEFYVPGIGPNKNALDTQQDDVALLFGKLMAYKAYESWLETHPSEGRLPGLPYTPKQLFWIASAMDECYQKRNHSRPSAEATEVEDDAVASHSIGGKSPKSIWKLRVVGPLRNSEDFAKDYRCPINSYMNPEDKCTLW